MPTNNPVIAITTEKAAYFTSFMVVVNMEVRLFF